MSSAEQTKSISIHIWPSPAYEKMVLVAIYQVDKAHLNAQHLLTQNTLKQDGLKNPYNRQIYFRNKIA